MATLRCVAANADRGPLAAVARAACNAGFALALSPTPAALRGDLMCDGPRPDVIAVEASDAAADDFALLRAIKRWDPLVEVLLVAPGADEGLAVQAIRLGALDVLEAPTEARARTVLERVLGDAERRRRVLELETQAGESYRFQGMVGRNPLMLDLFSLLARVAPHFSTVLVTGEPGTGKELAARALHDLSPRTSGPFVVYTCAALGEPALERRLFGQRDGAAAGGDGRALLEAASGGTVFLDEVAELGPAAQAGLVRVLERQALEPTGAAAPVPVDVRVVAASGRDLRALAREGRFREDLLRRLDALEIRVPPLRERKDDLPLLVRALLPGISATAGKEVRGVSRDAQTRLLAYDWPGNVGELVEVLRRAVTVAAGPFVALADLPPAIQAAAERPPGARPGAGRAPGPGRSRPADFPTLAEVERRHIERTLAVSHGNHARAALLLGISRQALYRKLAKYGLGRPAALALEGDTPEA